MSIVYALPLLVGSAPVALGVGPEDIARTALEVSDKPFHPVKRSGAENWNSNRTDCSNFVSDTLDQAGYGYLNLNSVGRWQKAVDEGRAIEVNRGGNSVTPCPELGWVVYWFDTYRKGQGISHVGLVADVESNKKTCRVTIVDHKGLSHGYYGARSFPMDLMHPNDRELDGVEINQVLRAKDRTLASQLIYGYSRPVPVGDAAGTADEPVAVRDNTPDEGSAEEEAGAPTTAQVVRERLTASVRDAKSPPREGERQRKRDQPLRFNNAELDMLDVQELRVLRNLVFARRGLPFDDRVLRCVFGAQAWYQPNLEQTADHTFQSLTQDESRLVARILERERGAKRKSPDRMPLLSTCEDAVSQLGDALKGRRKALEAPMTSDLLHAMSPEERETVMRHLVGRMDKSGGGDAAETLTRNLFTLVKATAAPLPVRGESDEG